MPTLEISPPALSDREIYDDVVRRTVDLTFPTPHPRLRHPARWARETLGGAWMWSGQRKIAYSVVHNRYTAIKSCHDIGKSWEAAVLTHWWLDVHPPGSAFVVTTAPSGPQVSAILWREIRQIHAAHSLAGRVTQDNRYLLNDALVAYGRKPADYNQAAFQGIHAEFVLVIIDEAGGIPKTLFDAADSLATNEDARVVAIGNPDDPSSHFAEICKPGSGWNIMTIPAWDTPNFTGEDVPSRLRRLLISQQWVEERRKRWGEGSPLWQSKVEAEFPEVTDDTLFTPAMIWAATRNELPGLEPGRFGLDIARFGSDETVCYRNRGGHVRLEWRASKQSTMATAGKAIQTLNEHHELIPMVADVIGVGSGVVDRMREQNHPVIAFNSARKANNSRRFLNLRAEAYWGFRRMLEDGEIDLDPLDEDLLAQLSGIKYKVPSHGKIQIESKEEMKKRGFPSPDRADAVVMASWAGATGHLDVDSHRVQASNGPEHRHQEPEGNLTGDLMGRQL